MTPRSPRSTRPARRVAAALSAAALVATLAACGEDGSANTDPTGVDSGSGLSALTVNGKFGEEPKLTWDDSVTVDTTQTDTVIEGKGDPVESGDTVLAHLLVANGVDKQVTSSDFSADAQVLTLGGQLLPAITSSLTGVTPGSRVVIAAPPKDAFPDGNPQLGIGNKDTVIFVIDVQTTIETEPHGAKQKAPAWAPKLKPATGAPESLDFAGTPQPTKDLQVATLVKGDGEKIAAGDSLYVNYLGQVYGGKQPFDSSFAQGQPFQVRDLGSGGVVKGWEQALEGSTVGSRLVVAVPPALGYGKAGKPEAKIKGTDTMYFVIDVVAKG